MLRVSRLVLLSILAIQISGPGIAKSECLASETTRPLATRPNIIIILADDLGYHDVGFNGLDDFATPHIDKLSREGVICRNGYSSHPFCAPARAGLLTGKYQHRFGFEGNPTANTPDKGLPPSEQTLADVLRRVNYDTAGIGKWHLGEAAEHHPLRRGFRSFFGFLEGSRSYFRTDLNWWTLDDSDALVERPHSPDSRSRYMTDLLTDEAVRFIKKDRDHPFLLYLAYNAPHSPLQATTQWLSRVQAIKDPKRRTYAAMVTALDDGIGKVRAALNLTGQKEKTLVFFFSDNGGITPVNAASNKPFSGFKGTLLEGGIHVPFVVSWPGVLTAGEYWEPVMTFDAFETSIVAAGITDSASETRASVDLLPYLSGEIEKAPHDTLYWRCGNGFQLAARRGIQKYLHVDGMAPRLFDLEVDLGERSPLADADSVLADAAKQWSNTMPATDFTAFGTKLKEQWQALGLELPPSRTP